MSPLWGGAFHGPEVRPSRPASADSTLPCEVTRCQMRVAGKGLTILGVHAPNMVSLPLQIIEITGSVDDGQ